MTTTGEVIDALGGTTAVALLTGRRTSAVANWRGFETFPADTYKIMLEALHARGKHAPAWMWRQEPKPGDEPDCRSELNEAS